MWNNELVERLRKEGLNQEQIGYVLGLLAEERTATDLVGYSPKQVPQDQGDKVSIQIDVPYGSFTFLKPLVKLQEDSSPLICSWANDENLQMLCIASKNLGFMSTYEKIRST